MRKGLCLSAGLACLFFGVAVLGAGENIKPVNYVKLNAVTDGAENSYTLAILHLRANTGVLGLMPKKGGMEFGFGSNLWFSGRFGSGYLFNPVAFTATKTNEGITPADCHLWNIVSWKYKKGSLLSMTYLSLPLMSSRNKVFFSKNQLGVGILGIRSEDTWRESEGWQHQLGPFYNQIFHEKLRGIFYFNLIQPRLLKVEFTTVL